LIPILIIIWIFKWDDPIEYVLLNSVKYFFILSQAILVGSLYGGVLFIVYAFVREGKQVIQYVNNMGLEIHL
jgi:hypothetical protein